MSDDKIKRLRTHVVKELYDTEADYTAHLEFTVTVCSECFHWRVRRLISQNCIRDTDLKGVASRAQACLLVARKTHVRTAPTCIYRRFCWRRRE